MSFPIKDFQWAFSIPLNAYIYTLIRNNTHVWCIMRDKQSMYGKIFDRPHFMDVSLHTIGILIKDEGKLSTNDMPIEEKRMCLGVCFQFEVQS
jgi:hypothetical protein